MTPLGWAQLALSRFRNFHGRSSRHEFWWFMAAIATVTLAITLVERMLGLAGAYGQFGLLSGLWFLAILVPSMSASIRRLHDTDRSGWWLLLAAVPTAVPLALSFAGVRLEGMVGIVQAITLVCNLTLLLLLVLPGVLGVNRFGEVAP